MYFEKLIAKRFLSRDKGSFSRPLVRIAVYTIALGVLVMIMAVSILRGFQNEITAKVVGFGSHINIRSYGWVNDYDEIPVNMTDRELQRVDAIDEVAHIQPYAYKGGMMKTDDQILGIIFKGVDSSFDSSFFARCMVKGRLANLGDTTATNEIVISQKIASRMQIDTGQKVRAYFWTGQTYRARAFTVAGVYNTDLNEFDDHYIIGDIRQIQKLNGWDSSMAAGYEIAINNFSNLYPVTRQVMAATDPDKMVTSIREEQPSMFAWLDLLNANIFLILAIMAVVCAASVVSALLIMIFEKTSMIGILKTLGSTNRSIRQIFLIKSVYIIGKGLAFGNVIALVLCLIQSSFHIVKLDTESYSMSFVPIDINLWYFLAIDAGTVIICCLALLLPSSYIAHILPAKTVRVE
ncbi:MAG: ABC transporter permease [Bacteroidales bacterium]|nr:ABC transporter permease [Bacteroidales bacterium]